MSAWPFELFEGGGGDIFFNSERNSAISMPDLASIQPVTARVVFHYRSL